MKQQEYEQKRVECWEEYVNMLNRNLATRYVFDFIFDRAYALGKQTETVTQEEIEKASVEYADKTAKQYEVCNSEFVQEIMVAFEQGANFALGKQEKAAEGEDKLLGVSRKQIDALQGEIFDAIMDAHDDDWQAAAHYILDVMPRSFAALFGSKCLPDGNEDNFASKEQEHDYTPNGCTHPNKENCRWKDKSLDCNLKNGCYYEPKPAEPKKKRHVSVKEACEILGVDESEATTLVKSKPIETCIDDCSSPDHFVVKDEMVDNIINDGFKNHNRLHIAAILAAGMLASEVRCYPVDRAFELADKLIAECKKGGGNA